MRWAMDHPDESYDDFLDGIELEIQRRKDARLHVVPEFEDEAECDEDA